MLAKLKPEYGEERTKQRSDLLQALESRAKLIGTLYGLVEKLEVIPADDALALDSFKSTLPDSTQTAVATMDHTQTLQRLRDRHATQLEIALRQEIPDDDKGVLGDVSDRLVTYDETAEAQEKTLVVR